MYLGEVDYIIIGSVQLTYNILQCTLWTT